METITTIISIIFAITIVLISIFLMLEKRSPSRTLAWLLILTFLPIFGFILYVFMGRQWRKKKWLQEKNLCDFRKQKNFFNYKENNVSKDLLINVPRHPLAYKLIKMNENNSHSPLMCNEELEAIFDGKVFYDQLFAAIKNATHHIHIIFFIVRDDEIGQQLKDLLIEKAQEGCEVRVLYDYVGSRGLKKRYIDGLKKAGVKIHSFSPIILIFPFLNRKLNYRNHRKITVIDGKVAFMGGFNLGVEYIGKNRRLGYWRDTHLKIVGNSVHSLQLIFLGDWYFVSKEKICGSWYFPVINNDSSSRKKYLAQTISSGPDSTWPSILQTYFQMVTGAASSVWITTPYLIPGQPLLMALKTAALSGIDVRIILPGNPDYRTIYLASKSYLSELLEAGVKVYLYQKGFIHSKMIICDEHIVNIGSANLDNRSFFINFEANTIIYNTEIASSARKQFLLDVENSLELEYETYLKRRWYIDLLESLARLFSPIF